MLGRTFRLRAQNTQNQAISVVLTARFWKFASDGSLTWSGEISLIPATSVSATTGTAVSTNYDNTTDKWIGAEFSMVTQAAVTTNGTGVIAITLERSTDTGTTWPTAGQGEFVGGYTVTAADTTSPVLKNLTVD
jgi:hypothetical protein